MSSMQQVAELKGHTASVASVAFNSSGKYLASGGSSDHSIRVWDVATQQQVAEMMHPFVNSVAFDPRGKYLASGSSGYYKTVMVWDMSTRLDKQNGVHEPTFRQVAKLEGHTSSVTSVAFNPSGKYLASGSEDGVMVWDVVFPSAPALDELQADEVKAAADEVNASAYAARSKYLSKLGFGRGRPGQGGRRSRKRNNRNKKRVKTLKNKKKYRSSRVRRFHSKNKK